MTRIFVILITVFMLGSIAYAINPHYFSMNGLKLTGAAAITDVRATFGFFPFAIGLFLLPGALRKTGHAMELRLITFMFGGIVAGRLFGIIVDKGDQTFNLQAMAIEAAVLVVAGILLQRETSRKTA